jgi:hypothetical protein
MATNHSDHLKNDNVKKILSSWSFFCELKTLAFVLKPLCDMVLALERRTADLSDCYFGLACISASMKKLPRGMNQEFRNHCINKNNERFREFDEDTYLLAFFLNPLYRGKLFFYFVFKNIHKLKLNIFN